MRYRPAVRPFPHCCDDLTVAPRNRFPGEITDEALDKEGGGSGRRCSFDIKSEARTREVGVDARTGTRIDRRLTARPAAAPA
jgi:hypothetical protein